MVVKSVSKIEELTCENCLLSSSYMPDQDDVKPSMRCLDLVFCKLEPDMSCPAKMKHDWCGHGLWLLDGDAVMSLKEIINKLITK